MMMDESRFSADSERMARQARELQERSFQASLRQAELFDRQMTAVRTMMDRAMSMTLMAAGATANASRGAIQTAAIGYGYGSAAVRQGLPQLSQAVGLGGGVFGQGPVNRGIEGPYYGGTQSFGGLLYEAGIGEALNRATGGVFFRDFNQVVGASPAMVGQRARDELALRLSSVGIGTLAAIPFANRTGAQQFALMPDIQRQMAQRLSFIASGGQAGGSASGRGFRSTSDLVSSIAFGSAEGLADINKSMGYGLGDDDATSLQRAAFSGMSKFELDRFSRLGTGTVADKSKQMVKAVKKMADEIKATAQEMEKIYAELGKVFDNESINGIIRSVTSGSLGSLNRDEAFAIFNDKATSSLRTGMSSRLSANSGKTSLNLSTAIYNDMRNRSLDKAQMSIYGSTDAEQQVNLQKAREMAGFQFGMGSPGIAALYANNPDMARQLESGNLGYFQSLQAQTTSLIGNPFGSLVARYDPATQERMRLGGRYAAYNTALNTANQIGRMRGADSRSMEALGIDYYAQLTQLDPMEAARQFRQTKAEAIHFGELIGGNEKEGLNALVLRDRVRAFNPDQDDATIAALYKRLKDNGLSDPSDINSVLAQDLLSKGSAPSNRALGVRPLIGGYEVKNSDWNNYDANGNKLLKGVYRNHSDSVGIATGDAQSMVDSLRAGGVGVDQINAELKKFGAGNQFRISSSGTLQVWSSLGRSDGKQVFQDASNVKWANQSIGADDWNSEAGIGFLNAMNSVSGNSADIVNQRLFADRGVQLTGSAGEYMLRNTTGSDLHSRLDQLFSDKFKRTGDQEKLRSLFDSSGRLKSGAWDVFGEKTARGFAQSLFLKNGMSEGDAAKKAAGIKSKEEFEQVMRGATDIQASTLRDQFSMMYIQRNESALASMNAATRGTYDNPIVVKVKDNVQ